jgi:hypothetical protein
LNASSVPLHTTNGGIYTYVIGKLKLSLFLRGASKIVGELTPPIEPDDGFRVYVNSGYEQVRPYYYGDDR